MSWRSSYLYCPECNSVYFANQIRPIPDGKRIDWVCPNALCNGVENLVTIDELMIKPVILLNEKGYATKYCCSGHELREDTTGYGYILFKKGVNLPSIPEGWIIDKTFMLDASACIRSTTDDLARSISNLNKWVESLEDRYYSDYVRGKERTV